MPSPDPELETLRAKVNCAAILEGWPSPWRLDVKESTTTALKYRRGAGEILIVNHGGRGWWDPQSDRKGDVFSLIQHLDARLNFGHVRCILRPFAGVSPRYPIAERRKTLPDVPIGAPATPFRRDGKHSATSSSSSSHAKISRAWPGPLNTPISRRNSSSARCGVRCAAWAFPAAAFSSPAAESASSSPCSPRLSPTNAR